MIRTINVFAVVVGLFVAGPVIVQADIVTEQYIFQVNHVDSTALPYFHLGDLIETTISYDNAGTYRSFWDDGVDGIAEFGDGDDVLLGTVGLDLTGEFKSDATFIFDDQINDYLKTFTDDTDTNYAYYQHNTDPFDFAVYVGDGIMVRFDTRDPVFTLGILDAVTPGVEDFISLDLVSAVLVDRTEINGHEPVPEPATMLLFGTGLAGLAGYRKKKAMK